MILAIGIVLYIISIMVSLVILVCMIRAITTKPRKYRRVIPSAINRERY